MLSALPAYRQPHWLIVDGLQGGSGESFDWHQLHQQASGFGQLSSHGWLLAGGLTPDTVAGAHTAGMVVECASCPAAAADPSLHCPHPLSSDAAAIGTAAPTGVDVSSGVCGPDGLSKDLDKVQRYCSSAWGALRAAPAAPSM